jgi:hypothetical protein
MAASVRLILHLRQTGSLALEPRGCKQVGRVVLLLAALSSGGHDLPFPPTRETPRGCYNGIEEHVVHNIP